MRCATFLLEAGALVDAATHQGATPMMVACQHGRHQLAVLLPLLNLVQCLIKPSSTTANCQTLLNPLPPLLLTSQ